MVAVVSGNGLGLTTSSLGTLGRGAVGLAPEGQGGEQVFVNSATGNLIVRGRDEFLSAAGLDLPLIRTYNSQGEFTDDNGDNWRLGVHEQLHSLTGTVNTAGSTIAKVFGDGAQIVYAYDPARGKYFSTEGDGAHDFLTYSAASTHWTWTDGSTRATQTYDSSGRLLSSQDADGNTTTYGYTGTLLTQITDASGQVTYLDYNGANLTQIRTVIDGETQTRTRYTYDSEDRLTEVIVDLSPEDNSVADGHRYVTSFTYDGASKRIASIAQTDGTSVGFTYEESGGQFRVKTYTDGNGQTTTIDYTASGIASVDANPAALVTTDTQTTETPHDLNSGALTTASAGLGPVASFDTPAITVNDPKLGFDGSGNGVALWRADGNLFAQRYDKASDTWGPQVVLDSRTNTVNSPSLSVDSAGNAVAAWVQNDGAANSAYVSRYDASTGAWSAATLLETAALAVPTAAGSIVTSADGGNAAVAWLQTDGTRNNLYVSRYNGSSWSSAELVETGSNAAADPSIGIDAQGNVTVLWQQSDGTANSIYVNRYTASAGIWSGASLLESSNAAANDPKIAFDSSGNAIAIWRAGGDLLARRYNKASDAWSSQVVVDSRNNTVNAPSLAVDSSGNAIAAWVQSDGTANSVYVSRYTAATATWSAAALLETSSLAVSTSLGNTMATISGNRAAVAWLQTDGTRNNLYVSRYNGTAWSAAELAETSDDPAAQPTVATDSQGNVTTLWQQVDGTGNGTIRSNRYSVESSAWHGAAVLKTPSSVANDPEIGFDSGGNGIALWRADGNLFAQRYDKATDTWGPQVVLDSRSNTVHSPSLSVDSAGNAVAAWVQSDGSANSVYVSRYSAAGNAWSAAALLENASLAVPTAAGSVTASISADRAAVAWLQTDGTRNNLYVARHDGTNWSVGELVEASDNAAADPSVAIDAQGNVTVLWQQSDGTANSLYMNRYTAGAGAWSGASLLESSNTVANDPKVAFDENGNGIAIWRAGGDLLARRYDKTSNAWSSQVVLDSRNNTVNMPSLSVDSAGNAVAAWVQSDGTANSVYVSRYAAASNTWSTATLLETASPAVSTAAGSLATAISGSRAAVAWLQTDGTRNNLYVARYSGAAWSAPELQDTSDDPAAQPSVAIDSQGNVTTLWQQSDSSRGLILQRRYKAETVTYYVVPSDATWPSIAQTLYGTSAVASQLQTALGNPPLTAGTHLTNLPASLTETTVVPVPPYYLVQSGDTWDSITQAVYGTSDEAAVAALQASLGNPTLTAGLHLSVPQTLSYSVEGGGLSTQTDITSPLGLVTTVRNNASGRVASLLSPAVGATRLRTDYEYDSDGNLVRVNEDPAGLNRVTAFEYDDAGNLLSTRDASGNTVTRTYSGTNKLLTETLYTVADPDGEGSEQPGGALTSRYTYDAEGHQRFAVSVEGRVTEHRYDTDGNRIATLRYTGAAYDVSALGPTATLSESTLATWAASQDPAQLERIDYDYDFRGNLSSATAFGASDAAGVGIASTASVTHYVYNQHGQLIQTIDPRGEATSADPDDYVTTYTYDGLGRLLSTTQWVASGASTTTLNSYDDANQQASVTLANGLVTTHVFDGTGRLVSIARSVSSQALGTTTYAYDADGRLRMVTDPTGIRSHALYDGAGRKVAEVDGDGTLTEYVFDAASRNVKTIRYAVRLDTSTLVDGGGNPEDVSLASLRTAANTNPTHNQISRLVYDGAGRVVYTVDEEGAVTEMRYDGASRLTDVLAYANRVSISSSIDELTPSAVDALLTSSAEDRRTRNLYDGDGRLRGVLDAAGYLVEYVYDGAGRLAETIGYAAATPLAARASGDLDALRPEADAQNDVVSRFFYDGQGRRVGSLDSEGYLTETVYDPAGNAAQIIRYDVRRTYASGDTFEDLRPASLGDSQVTSYQYDGLNRLIQETNHEGTITRYQYDSVGNLVSSTRALSTAEARTAQVRHDALGRVVAELTPEGSTQIAGGMTQTQIDAIWDQYGIQHTYDLAGRRTSTTDQNGNTILFFYDADGRLTHTVNELGEVVESHYNGLNQRTESIAYAGRISITGLSGGLVDATLTGRVSAAADPAKDSHTTIAYTRTGRIEVTGTAEGGSIVRTYNAFGEETSRSEAIDFTHTLDHEYRYDARGLLTQTVWDPSGLNTSETNEYDAFGRLARSTDSNGNVREREYDRLGRAIETIDPLNGHRSTTYDAFSRTLTATDALGNTTEYAYDDEARSVVVTTPEGISFTTVRNRHGETASVTDGRGNTATYEYDANGRLTGTADSLGTWMEQTYDKAGRAVDTTDANGVVTRLLYDAADRVFMRVVDPDGLALTTTYFYNGKGEAIEVTDANGVLTRTDYDADGRVVQVAVDPNGLNLRTSYEYNLRGDGVLVTEGVGTLNRRVTKYVYDALGRRTSEIVDPGAGKLNLTTDYRYDGNGNVVRKTDANGNVTRYVYDANNRLRYTVDPLGGVTERIYDAEGRIAATRRYATAIAAASLPGSDPATIAQVETLLQADPLDRLEQSVYDDDGREAFSIDSMGGVTRKEYDGNGNVVRERIYSERVAAATYTTVAQVDAALALVDDGNTANDREMRSVYDARNRASFTLDGLGGVVRTEYDGAGNVTTRTAFATPRSGSDVPSLAAMQTWTGANADPAQDRTTRAWYDAANRPVFTLDAEGFLHETVYDDVGRVIEEIDYTDAVTVGSNADLADVITARNAGIDNGHDQHTERDYDDAGRLISVTDALGNTESYSYDAVGNRLSMTNKKGSTWVYEYDANRRLIFERSPQVAVTTVSASGGSLVSSTNNSLSIVTYIEYDALRNVIRRTEAYGTSQNRITEYVYDALGRQVRTNFPTLNVYDSSIDNLERVGAEVVRTEIPVSPYTETTYDTLGNAIRNRDIAGNYSHKVYDALGRVLYDVDAERYVTQYGYDTFGNRTAVTRYAGKLDDTGIATSTLLTASSVAGRMAESPTADRTIETQYDRLNRAITVTQLEVFNFAPAIDAAGGQTFTASPTTRNEYNAFGQVVRQRELVNPLTTMYADTYFYYDQRGLKTAQVDALGYLTTFEYDEFGNLSRQVEYAKPLAAEGWDAEGHDSPTLTTPATSPNDPAGYDREVVFAYDRLNRKISETRVDIAYSQVSGSGVSSSVDDQTTTFGYDALGNQTHVTDAAGASTYTYYDVLGRQIASAAPSRDPGDGTTLIPLSLFKRDVFGNMVEQVVYANGASAASATSFTAGAPNSNDRTTRLKLDSYGNAVQTQDPTGAQRYASYNLRSEVAKEWQLVTDNDSNVDALVTVYDYDRLGRQTTIVEPLRLPRDGEDETPVELIYSHANYNAFGEVISKWTNGGLQEEFFNYDQAGRVWRTNAGDGVVKIYLYDLAGRATAEIRSQQLDLSGYSQTQAAALTSQRMRTETRYDLLGRVVEQRQPKFVTSTADTGLQNIGSQLRVDANLLGPSNPDAVYRAITIGYDWWGYGIPQVFTILDPSATVAQGGGYYHVAPTASDPYSFPVQDSSYHLEASTYINWARPPEYVSGFGTPAIEAEFQYRVAGSGGSWTSLQVAALPNSRLGVKIAGISNGDYEYRLTYRRVNEASPYAIATGEMEVSGSGTVLTDTTAATLSGGSEPVSVVINQTPINTEFSNAQFQIGDPEERGIDPYVYRRVVTGALTDYVADRTATVAQGGGYYLTGSGYVQDTDYQVSTSRYVSWNIPTDETLTPVFEYRLSGVTTSSWNLRTVVELAGDRYGVAIGDLDAGQYEFRVSYVPTGETDAVATAQGTFGVEAVKVTGTVSLNMDPPDDAGFVAPISGKLPGGVSASIFESAQVIDYDAITKSEGVNDVIAYFPPVEGYVYVEITYQTRAYYPIYYASYPSTQVTRTVTLFVEDASHADGGVHIVWADPENYYQTGSNYQEDVARGIQSIQTVRVYKNYELLYSTEGNTSGNALTWRAPRSESVVATFEARPVGSSTWQTLEVVRNNNYFSVDTTELAHGSWEYQVSYVRDGDVTATAEGTFDVASTWWLQLPEVVRPPETIPTLHSLDASESISEIGFYINDSTRPVYEGDTEYVDGFDAEPDVSWTGTNIIEAFWPELSTGNVRVEVDYISAPTRKYVEVSSSPSRWQLSGTNAGVSLTETFDLTDAEEGGTLEWEDDPGAVGGVRTVEAIRVYSDDGLGGWVLEYELDGNNETFGRGVYWDYREVYNEDEEFEFRIRPSGTSSWETREIYWGNDLISVNLDDLEEDDYDYEILSQVYDEEIDGYRILSRKAGVLSVPGSSSTDPIGITQTDVVYNDAENDFEVLADGTELSWTRATTSGDTVVVKHRLVGETTWDESSPTGTSPDFSIDLGSGAVEFEIHYIHSGQTTPYVSASGTLNKELATPIDSLAGTITSIRGFNTDLVEIGQTSSSFQEVVGPIWFVKDEPFHTVWDGTNEVELSWPDLETDGDVKVVLDYWTNIPQYGYGYENNPYADEGEEFFQSGWVPWGGSGGQAHQSRTFNLSDVATGATLAWSDANDAKFGGISDVQRVRVYTKDISNNWVLRYDRDGAAQVGGKSLSFIRPEYAGSYELDVAFKIKLKTEDTWQTLVSEDIQYGFVDLNEFDNGEYDYQLTYFENGLISDVASGSLIITDDGGGMIQVTQTNLQFVDGPGDMGLISAEGTDISWTQEPDSGDSILVKYRALGATTWLEEPITGSPPELTADLSAAGTGAIEFQILYTHDLESEPYIESHGILNKTRKSSSRIPLIESTQTNTFTSLAPVTGLTNAGGFLSWTNAAESGSTVTFRYQLEDDSWQEFTPVANGTGFAVDQRVLPPGTYAYEIRYNRPSEDVPYIYGSGTMTIARQTSGGALTLVDNTQFFQTSVTEVDPNIPTLTQTLDRWGSVLGVTDALDRTTNYRYNQFGQMIETKLPEVSVTDTTGGTVTTSTQRPAASNHYNLLGRLIATEDANGNVTSVAYNNGGELISETHADGGTQEYLYDAFGQQIEISDELDFKTRNTYDKTGNLVQVNREIEAGEFGWSSPGMQETYAYDSTGRRISETNGASETTQYWYDLQGNLIKRSTPRGFETTARFDAQGKKIEETDANGNTQSWTYDFFGRLTGHTDMGGATSQYAYDRAGALTRQTNSLGQDLNFAYDEAGHLARITDQGTPAASSSLAASNRVTEYGYDRAGQRVWERTQVDGRMQQDTRIAYDALGRVVTMSDPDYVATYKYDAVGNRSNINAEYYNHDGYGTGNLQAQDLWYTYDEMNRLTTSQGVNNSGTIGISSSQGVQLTYTLRNERASAYTYGEHYATEQVEIEIPGFPFPIEVTQYSKSAGYTTEEYEYDGIGRLKTTAKDDILINSKQYDGASREILDERTSIDGTSPTSSPTFRTIQTTYDADGRAQIQTTRKNGVKESVITYGDSVYTPASTVPYFDPFFFNYQDWVTPAHWTQGYDDAGVLRGYSVAVYDASGRYKYTTTYKLDYRLGEGYQQTQESASSTSGGPLPGLTTRGYNVNGELVRFTDTKDATQNRYFANNAQGQALTVVQGNFDGQSGRLTADQAMANAIARTGNQVKAQHFFFANGQQVGSFGQLQDAGSDFKANFDVNYTPISDSYPASTPSQVIVQAGDTLRVIAARVFGDANLWYLIAEENGLTEPDAELEEGTILRVPNDVVSLSNSATSFKPFDVSDAIGDTTPTQPMPPPRKKKGCGVIGQILSVVVAIVVTIYTGGILGAALGSALGQGVAIATGVQDKFSWKAVASAALTAGLMPVSNALTSGLSGVTQQIASAAINNAVGQGVNIALGLQESFSWKAVAASAIAAPIAASIGNKAGEGVGKALKSDFAGQLAGQAAYGLTMAATRSAFMGGKIDYAQIAADSFANVIGNSLVEKLSKPSSQPVKVSKGSSEPATSNPKMNNNPLPFDEQEMLRKFEAENRANLEQTIAGMKIPEIGAFEYEVQPGDTLSQIAVQMGLGPEGAVAIAKANGIADLNQVRAGQTIVIPDSAGYDRAGARQEYGQFLEDTNVRNAEYAARSGTGVNFMTSSEARINGNTPAGDYGDNFEATNAYTGDTSLFGGLERSTLAGATLGLGERIATINRVTTATSRLDFAAFTQADVQRLIAVDSLGSAYPATLLTTRTAGLELLTDATESKFLFSDKIVPRSTNVLLDSGLDLAFDVHPNGATVGAVGYVARTTTSAGSLSAGLAKTLKVANLPAVGGLIDVGFNALNGDYALYEPTQEDIIKNRIGLAYDFGAGTFNSAVSGTVGTAAGAVVTGVVAPVTGPAAPFVGVATGIGTGAYINSRLNTFTNTLRPSVVNATYHVYQNYESTVDFTSRKIIEPLLK